MKWTRNGRQWVWQRSALLSGRLPCCVAVACAIVFAVAGCVERKERIIIAADRSVTIQLEYEGGPGELDGGDAMPSAAAGWDVTRTVKKDGQDEKHVLSAQRTFAPGEPLPRSFAPPGDPDTRLYLDFPTTLGVQTEGCADGVYYHFRRVYTPRRWAYVSYWDDRLTEEIKNLSDKPVEAMTPEERIQVARAVAGVEAHRHVEFAREAVREAAQNTVPYSWLSTRRAIFDVYEAVDWNRVIDRYIGLPEDERDEYFEQSTRRIWEEAHQAVLRLLRNEAGLDDSGITRFELAFERAQRYYDITSSLGGHLFELRVKMPGQIVAHNADRLDDNGEAVWEFKGNAFRDRSFELLVTSRLQPAPQTD